MNNNEKQQKIDKANEHAYDNNYDSMWDKHYEAKFNSAESDKKN